MGARDGRRHGVGVIMAMAQAGYGMFATNMIIGQFVLSALTSALWVYKTYTLEVEDWVANLEFGTATFFCVWLVQPPPPGLGLGTTSRQVPKPFESVTTLFTLQGMN